MNETIILETIKHYENGQGWKEYLQSHCLDDTQFNKVFGGVKNATK